MKTTNAEVATQLRDMADFIETDGHAEYSVDFDESEGARTITIKSEPRGANWLESSEVFLNRLEGLKESIGDRPDEELPKAPGSVLDWKKYERAMGLSRGLSEDDFEESRKCAVDMLKNHRAMGECEFRDLVANLLALLVATR